MYLATHIDTVVAATIGLINAATPGEREGQPYDPAAAQLHEAIDAAVRTERRTRRVPKTAVAAMTAIASRLRQAVEAIDAGEYDRAAALINTMLADSAARPHLERKPDEPWHLHFHGPTGRTAESLATNWLASMATGLAVVLGSEYADRLGVCSAPACDRVFLDTSRNGSRRFCGIGCQSRVKTAAYRARRSRTP